MKATHSITYRTGRELVKPCIGVGQVVRGNDTGEKANWLWQGGHRTQPAGWSPKIRIGNYVCVSKRLAHKLDLNLPLIGYFMVDEGFLDLLWSTFEGKTSLFQMILENR